MASLMDTLGSLARQVTQQSAGQGGIGGSLGGLLGGVANTLGGQSGAQVSGGGAPASQHTAPLGGLGGLLGSAAVGGVLGALLTNKSVRKVAGNAALVGGGAIAATLAWKYFQKWNAGSGSSQTPHQLSPQHAPMQHSAPLAPSYGDGWAGLAQAPAQQTPEPTQGQAQAQTPALQTQEQERLAETLLMAMIFAARSDGHLDEQEKANINMVLNSIQNGDESEKTIQQLMHRPVNPDELAARVRTREEGEDVYRLSCLIVHIDQYMERSYMDGLARALHLSDADKNELERQAADIKAQAGA